MDCQSCRECFTDVQEEVEGKRVQEAREHLQQCEHCRADFAEFQQVVACLRELPLVSPPAGLLPGISAALNRQQPRRRPWLVYWQPLTAGVSMAICCLMVAWSMLGQPGRSLAPATAVPVATSAVASPDQAVAAPATRAVTSLAARPAVSPSEKASGRLGKRSGQNHGAVEASLPTAPVVRRLAPRPRPQPSLDWGRWASSYRPSPGVSTKATAPAASAVTKPARTFAAEDAPRPRIPHLLRKSPGEVKIAFIPPTDRPVGTAVVGELAIDSQAQGHIVVTVAPHAGLQVTNAPAGVLYRGALRRGDSLRLPVKLLATEAGARRLRVHVASDVPMVVTDLYVTVPGFTGDLVTVKDRPVKLTFHETPALQAIREMANQVGARVVIDDGVDNTQLITQDYSAGVPFEAALRTLCDSCGYRMVVKAGVYHIEK